jgi:uncharacterized protein
MKLDLSEIATHLGKRIRYEIDEPPVEELDDGVRCLEPVKGDVTFSNTGRHIVARGSFSTAVEIECARCLRLYRAELSLPIEEEMSIAGHLADLPEEEQQEEEEIEPYSEPLFVDHIFDLTEMLRQTILVALPIKPLCFEECKGLCPQCGKNLNDGPCGCPPDTETTPFAALAGLLKEEKEES